MGKVMNDKRQANDILFEIGAEELPATALADVYSQAENIFELKFKKLLEESRISFSSVKVLATPRRLVFLAKEASSTQSAKDTLTKLFAKSDAYDADGKPTEKFLTILKHRQVTVADTVVSDFNGKEFIFIKKAESALKTTQVLPKLCEDLVRTLGFAKPMKWDASGIVFSRPIRNYLCFYGATPVKFKIGFTDVKPHTSFFSKSKRTLVAVKDPEHYFKTLKAKGVILDSVERRKVIESELQKLAKSFNAKLYDDPFLMNEVVFLVENPCALSAPFDKEFLKLPLEVLTVSMARKQRIFGLTDSKGNVIPRFLAVLDGQANTAQKNKISKNIENILHAKLKDSLFFFQEDTKAPLDKKREELKNLVFLKGAGSMNEKSSRMMNLSRAVSVRLGLSGEESQDLERACMLAKADLLTLMVGEFPELQGVMGKYYSKASGDRSNVSDAIGEQYLPRTVSDKLPASKLGAIVSILDKMDLISACFGQGLEPSSSADPYGLRRSAAAVIRIVLEKNLNLSFSELIDGATAELSASNFKQKIEDLFKDRFRALMGDKGFRPDVVEAVLSGRPFDNIKELEQKITAISKLATQPFFPNACKVVERISNILKGVKESFSGQAEAGLLIEPAEKKVFESFEKTKSQIGQLIGSSELERATSLYAETFFDILSEFFETVFVNAEDPNVRKNRVLLLKNVKDLYTHGVADLSKIKL